MRAARAAAISASMRSPVSAASGSSAASFHTRSLALLGGGSRASVIETYAGEGRYWRNDVLAARLAEGATLHRAVAVEESPDALHFGHLDATLAAQARLAGFALLLGGRRTRHEGHVRLAGETARCRLDGAFLVGGNDEDAQSSGSSESMSSSMAGLHAMH